MYRTSCVLFANVSFFQENSLFPELNLTEMLIETFTVNKLVSWLSIFSLLSLCFCDDFLGLQNWSRQEQRTVCLYRHISGDLFWRISLSFENKSLAKIN